MSVLIQYIRSLEDQTYEGVKNHFVGMGLRVMEDGDRYMITVPNEMDLSDKPYLQFAIGTILNKSDHSIRCVGFPKTMDVDKNAVFPMNGAFCASEYIVGTLLRAYWDGEMWRLTTNGNMNAYESYWISQKSFGELFDACLSRIYKSTTVFSRSPLVDKMNTNYCYQFLISDPSVHLDQSVKSYIYHVGTYDLSNGTYVYDVELMDKIHKPRTHVFSTREDLENHLKKSKGVFGYILYPSENSSTQSSRYKYLTDHFSYLKELIGNTPDMYLRYLECKYEGRSNELIMNFPSIRYYSSWIEKCLSDIVQTSYQLYVEKYIKKQPELFVNFFYRPILGDLHKKYNEGRIKINLKTVNEIVHGYHPKRLHFILNGLKYIETRNIIDPSTVVEPSTNCCLVTDCSPATDCCGAYEGCPATDCCGANEICPAKDNNVTDHS